MKISNEGIALIKEFEGYHRRLPDGRCAAYQERLNGGKLDIPTIGYGCTEGVTMGMVWTEAEAEAALVRELAKHEAIVARLVTVHITQHQFDALVSFSFNVGKLGSSTLLKKLNQGDTSGAGEQFMAWTKAGGHEQPGLVRRRSAERALFLKPGAPEPMPQSVDEAAQKPLTQSGTVWGSVGAGAAGALAYLEEGWHTATQTMAALTELQPLRDSIATAGGNAKAIAFSATLGCLALVICRRIKAASEGKPG